MLFRYRRHPTAETVGGGILFVVALAAITLYFTRDAGDAGAPSSGWTRLNTGVEDTLLDVHFADDAHGWAVGERGAIIATADGGESWRRQSSGYQVALRGVHFADRRNGWAVGNLGLILRTTDGGETWAAQAEEAALGQDLIAVGFGDAGSGWIIAERGGFSLRTADGGESWHRQFFDNTLPRSAAHVLDERRAWVAMRSGAAMSTADGGESWRLNEGVNGARIGALGVFFADERRGWIAGWRGKAGGVSSGVQFVKYLTDGMVARTVDGGESWTRVDADAGRFLWDVAFADAMNGWAVGSFGLIMRSTDGGESWTQEPDASDSTLRALHLESADMGWAVGENGAAIRRGNR